jgi:hypothetical protein
MLQQSALEMLMMHYLDHVPVLLMLQQQMFTLLMISTQ